MLAKVVAVLTNTWLVTLLLRYHRAFGADTCMVPAPCRSNAHAGHYTALDDLLVGSRHHSSVLQERCVGLFQRQIHGLLIPNKILLMSAHMLLCCCADAIIDELGLMANEGSVKEGYYKEPGEFGTWMRTTSREGTRYTEKCEACRPYQARWTPNEKASAASAVHWIWMSLVRAPDGLLMCLLPSL